MTDSESIDGLSNWGRWGAEDELGTLNLITDETRARALREARTGRVVSLARPIDPASMMGGPFAPPTPPSPPVQQAMLYTGVPPMGMAEVLVVTPHNPGLTHLDALVHIPVDGQVYPGRPLTDAVTPTGVLHGSTTAFADGVLTRGVLLDLAPDDRLPPAHPVTGADLDAAEHRTGVRLEPGDALVVRGGWEFSRDPANPMPGMTLDAIAWMRHRDVSVYAGDIGDAHPPVDSQVPMPLHLVGLARLGMPLIDGAEVDALAAVCAELGRYAFLLTIAPPRLRGATGVPVNPQAIF
ncbi:cyclase family protein [Actinomycetospora endophytica]|uniref:Cyclase family protein n=1 Tax=Actinomycetospora endophytica TaxID=2291215 RepID=A0ABS8PAL5_9PSEU|nr:cyclase family protein [Actinomycetospora endophytica]MCD2195301.1 cyclase family protein [Actinomycetospora endophytica]